MILTQDYTILVGGFATLAIFSFLIKENPFYRIFEHLFIGIATAYGTIVTLKSFLWPNILVPLLGLDIVQFPDGTLSKEYNYALLLYILPMLFGLLYYFLFSNKYNWLAKLVIGLSLGASGGMAFKGFFAEMIPQVSSSFKPLVVFHAQGIDWASSFSNIVFVYALIAVMLYFFFTFKIENTALKKVANSGRWLMMLCFGAFFGSTVMARMALLVERLQFLIESWWPTLGRLF